LDHGYATSFRDRQSHVLLEVTVALAVGGRGAKERDVDADGFASIDCGPRAVIDFPFLSAQKTGEGLKAVLYLAIDRNAGSFQQKRHLEVTKTLPPAPREVEVPSGRFDRVGPCHHRQREGEIIAVTPKWSNDVDVNWSLLPRKGLPVARDDAPSRLVPVDAAKVRWVAN